MCQVRSLDVLPYRCVHRSFCLRYEYFIYSLDFVVLSGKPEMTSTLLKYKAELLSALARIGDSPTRFSLHNVYFYHLSRVTKSDIVNLLCKRTRIEILFYEVTWEYGKAQSYSTSPNRRQAMRHRHDSVKSQYVHRTPEHLTSFVERNWKLLSSRWLTKIG